MAITINIGGDNTLFIGEDKDFTHEVLDASGVPVDVTGMSFHFVVRLHDSDTGSPIFDKTATVVGVYNVTRALNTQRLKVSLTSTEMGTLVTRAYRYSWRRVDAPRTVTGRGDFYPEQSPDQ